MTCIRMDLMLQLFQEFLTPQQKELKEKVKDMGGVAALDDEKAMQELAGAEFDLADFVELQQEIKGDVDQAIEKNDKFFSRMFNIQRREIQDLALMVHREGDRVISAMTAGPHDRIVDPVRRDIFTPDDDPQLTLDLRISIISGRTW